MKKSFLAMILVVLAIAAAWYFRADIVREYEKIVLGLRENIGRGLEELEQIERTVLTPPPLRGPTESVASALTHEGVLAETNRHRAENGLPPLRANAALTQAAQAKVDDMFARQYFEHTSPSGDGPGELAAEADYEYLTVGENLALGNYRNDTALVEAWMNSPGHRKNILKPAFTEIGVALGRGVFEGETLWLAVQEFGRPASLCPSPDTTLAHQIEANQAQLDALKSELDRRKQELDETRPKRGPAYNEKVEAYNALVAEFNALVAKTKSLVATYNEDVREYNRCIQ